MDDSKKQYTVGIDIGTSFSSACILNCSNHRSEMITFEEDTFMPSVVNFANPTNIKVGKAACIIEDIVNGNVVRCNKLILGRKRNDTQIQKFIPLCDAKVIEDENGYCAYAIPTIGVVSTQRVVEELLKCIYKSILDKMDGNVPQAVCITVPATFSQIQKGIMRHAAQTVIKNTQIRLCSEPSAGAIGFSFSQSLRNGHYVIYDLGGGTFDVSVLRIQDGVYEIVKTRGHPTIGGSRFDLSILNFISYQYECIVEGKEGILPSPANTLVYQSSKYKVLEMCCKAKTALSIPGTQSVSFDISELFSFLSPYQRVDRECILDYDYNLSLSLSKFEQLVYNDLLTTVNITEECIRDCGLSIKDINQIILIGGSSAIPLVHRLLSERFGGILNKTVNPRVCVALGASYLFHSDEFKKEGQRIQEKSVYDIALMVAYGKFKTILAANSPLPCSCEKVFYTSGSNVGCFCTDIYEKRDEEYEKVNKHQIRVIDKALEYRRVPIRVFFSLTETGELTVRMLNDDNKCELKQETFVIDL